MSLEGSMGQGGEPLKLVEARKGLVGRKAKLPGLLPWNEAPVGIGT